MAQLDSADVSAKLFKAIESGDLDGVRDLLDADPRLATARNRDGASALTWATYYRKKPIVDLLLERGGRPDIFESSAIGLTDRVTELVRADRALLERYSFDGWTPLHLAAHFGHTEAMKILISNGASHRAVSRNANGNQPLQAATAGGRSEAVALLLKAGADPDARSHGGLTALHIAAANGNAEIVRRLLEAGADPGLRSEGGKTAIEFAIEGDRAEVVDLLEKARTP